MIVCLGLTPCLQRTLILDSFARGEVNRVKCMKLSASGKATNVARVLNTLKTPYVLTGFVGGTTAKEFLQYLDQEAIQSDFVWSQHPTRICQTILDHAHGDATELVEEAHVPDEEDCTQLSAKLRFLFSKAKLLTISGALPPGTDEKLYSKIIASASDCGIPVLLDTQKTPLLQSLGNTPLLIKPNLRELRATLNQEINSTREILHATRSLIQKGARWVLVTNGSRDAFLVSENQEWSFQPPQIEVRNPIGSGDSMTAGIAFGLSQNWDMPEAVRYGVACGAANALTELPGQVDPAQVSTLLNEIEARAL